MSVAELTIQELQESIQNENLLIVDIYGSSCSPCKALAPIFDKVAGETPDITFVKVVAEQDGAKEYLTSLGIRGVPTLLFIKQGEIIKRHTGFIPESKLLELVKSLEA